MNKILRAAFLQFIYCTVTVLPSFSQEMVSNHNISGLSRPINEQDIQVVKKKPFVLDFNKTDGWKIWDINLGKSLTIKDFSGLDEKHADSEIVMADLGSFNNIFYFAIMYQLVNGDRRKPNDEFARTELWSFDGEKLAKIDTWNNHGPINFYNTGNNLYTGNLFRSSYSFLKIEGNTIKNLKAVLPENSKDKFDHYVDVYRGALLLRTYPNDNKQKYLSYSNDKLSTVYDGEHSLLIYLTCNKAFISRLTGNYITLGTFETTTGIRIKANSLLSNIMFSHGNDNLIYGYMEDASNNVNAGPNDGLYITDGTKSGTKLLSKDIFRNPDFTKWVPSSSSYKGLTYFMFEERNQIKNTLFYTLWKTDGTALGTKKILTSQKKIFKVINHKGMPIYARDSTSKFGQLYTIKNNKEVPILTSQKGAKLMIFKNDPEENLDYRYQIKNDGRIYVIPDKESLTVTTVDLLPNVKYLPDTCLEPDLNAAPVEEIKMVEICGNVMLDDFSQADKSLQHNYSYERKICSVKDNPNCTVENVYNFILKDVNYQAPESYSILEPLCPTDYSSISAVMLSSFKNYLLSLPEKEIPKNANISSKLKGILKVIDFQSTKKIIDCMKYDLAGPGLTQDPLKKQTYMDEFWSHIGKYAEQNPNIEYNLRYGESLYLKANPILINTNRSSYTFVNRTLNGHFLHPGKVTRQVVVDNGFVKILTEGQGITENKEANYIIGAMFFKLIDERLSLDFFNVSNSPKAWQNYQKLK